MQNKISKELDEMCCALIGRMLELWASGTEPEVTLVVGGTCSEIFTFSQDEPDQCLEAARAAVRAMSGNVAKLDPRYSNTEIDRYALAYSGVVTVDEDGIPTDNESGRLCDALILEFGEQTMAHAWSCVTLVDVTGTDLMYSDPYPGGEVERLL